MTSSLDRGEDDDAMILLILASIPRQLQTGAIPIDFMSFDNDSFKTTFRFNKSDFNRLFQGLKIPTVLRAGLRLHVDGQTALLMLLFRLAYPVRLCNVAAAFGYSSSSCSRFLKAAFQFIHSKWGHLLYWHDGRLTSQKLAFFASRIANAGAPLSKCVGFIDGTLRPCSRPEEDQRLAYNGHRRIHAIKFQGIMGPDGIFMHMSGSYPASHHDSRILHDSGILSHLQDRLMIDGCQHYLYADGGYPLLPSLITPYKGNDITEQQAVFNVVMGEARRCVEHGFAKVIQQFSFLDYRKNLKKGLQPINVYYQVGTILTNCHTALYGSQTGDYFNCRAPELEEYLIED